MMRDTFNQQEVHISIVILYKIIAKVSVIK